MTDQLPPASDQWAYFLDVDGTLIELADLPEGVQIDRGLPSLIDRLYQASDGAVAIVSGRSLANLDHHLGLLHLPMAGLHGLEQRDAAGRIVQFSSPAESESIRAIARQLEPLRRKHADLLFEDKGSTLAVHYRRLPRLGSYLHQYIGKLTRNAPGGLHMQAGKRVLEIKQRGHDKGSAIRAFMARPPFSGRRPVFIGDDLTDEHGFNVVNQMDGISVKVGIGRSKARYRLKNVTAVHAWLAGIFTAKQNGSTERNPIELS